MLRRTVKDLEFTDVLQQIKAFCLSAEGRSQIDDDPLISEAEAYLAKQGKVEAIGVLLSENIDTGLKSFPDIGASLSLLQDRPYESLDAVSLYDLGVYLGGALSLQRFLTLPSQDGRVAGAGLGGLVGEIDENLKDLKDSIFKVLEEPGQVKKTHPAIAKALAEIDRRRSERSGYSAALVNDNRDIMQSDKPSYKDSRVVIPLKADQKSRMPGLVHSLSASNQTLYVEPYRLVELNNGVVMAEQNLQLEIARLIRELSDKAARFEMDLRMLSRRVGIADSLCAYAAWARNEGCCKVQISNDGSLSLISCRHPLLRGKAVPVTVLMAPNTKALVISGPNAGGKTVTIKTVGLMAMLNQLCGYVPAADGTKLALFDNVFTDIGDDQSIEAELSTFSGHMNQVGFILRTMTGKSLVILDELGSGTDEMEGSAIAKAVLQYCMGHAGTTLISSHHNALKQFAYVTDNVMNASMEFDESTHKPTFRVIAGLPGESHAIDTAIRMKLPDEVITAAREYLGRDEVSVSKLIKELEQRRIEAERRLEAIDARQKELGDQKRRNDLRALQLDQKEYFIKEGKLKELDSYISRSRRDLENLVTQLREGELTREKTKQVKQFIEGMQSDQKDFEARIEDKAQSISRRYAAGAGDKAVKKKIEPGSIVLCGASRREGVVVRSAGRGKWQVAVGQMRFTFPENELEPAPNRENRPAMVQYSLATARPKLVIDVRGMTLEGAVSALADQIEACMVHGMESFSIIHGYGDGILSRGLHDYLSKARGIAEFRFAMPDDGGQGKTYVKLG